MKQKSSIGFLRRRKIEEEKTATAKQKLTGLGGGHCCLQKRDPARQPLFSRNDFRPLAFVFPMMATRGRPRGSGKGKRPSLPACDSGESGAKKKKGQSFLSSYTEAYSCIVPSRLGTNYAKCSVCVLDFIISHGGFDDVKKHVKSVRHTSKAAALQNSSSLMDIMGAKDGSTDLKGIRAETLFTCFLVEHNVALSAGDHAGKLFRTMFPDSTIAQGFGCAKTKTTSIIKECARESKAQLVDCMLKGPFVVGTDGSQEGEDKHFPIVIRALDPDGNIKTELLSVPSCDKSATGENIFKLLDSELRAAKVSWSNCLAFVTDNANVMVGVKKGVISFIREKHKDVFLAGCVCHLLNLTVKKAMKASARYDLDDTMRQLSWYFSKSSTRQQRFRQIQQDLDLPNHKIIDHVPTRWLSLGAALDRVIEQWRALDKFFREECSLKTASSSSEKTDPPVRQRLGDFFKRRTTKLYVLFYATVLEIFTKVNKLEQTDSARIHVIKRDLEQLYRRLLVSFLKPSALSSGSLMEVDFKSAYNHKAEKDIFIGGTTRELLETLDEKQQKAFLGHVKTFYKEACMYMQVKLNPAKEILWKHAEVADVSLQNSAQVSSLRYFFKRFPCSLPPETTPDDLELEFSDYQAATLPPTVLHESSAELQWKHIGAMKDHNGACNLKRLSVFMLTILLIPVSNCACERIFSQVRRNKTDFRGTIGGETLDALMVIKARKEGPCYDTTLSDELLRKCKSATRRQQAEQRASASTSQ